MLGTRTESNKLGGGEEKTSAVPTEDALQRLYTHRIDGGHVRVLQQIHPRDSRLDTLGKAASGVLCFYPNAERQSRVRDRERQQWV